MFTDPISLGIMALFAFLAVLDLAVPARQFPKIRNWRIKGTVFFLFSMALSGWLPLLWDETLASWRLLDLTGLGHGWGAVVALLGFQLGLYAWHRCLHRIPFLWRWSHQMHHSAERIDVFGAFYFHPLDILAFSLLSSLVLVLGLGVSGPAAAIALVFSTFCSLFQHANIRTPRWLGYLIQRPESHSIHHQRGVHAYNYGDIPFWDMVFGTFRNPPEFDGVGGFYDGASRRLLPMLLGRDVSQPESRAPLAPTRLRPASSVSGCATPRETATASR